MQTSPAQKRVLEAARPVERDYEVGDVPYFPTEIQACVGQSRYIDHGGRVGADELVRWDSVPAQLERDQYLCARGAGFQGAFGPSIEEACCS